MSGPSPARADLAASFRAQRRALGDGGVMRLPELAVGQDWITDLASAAGFRLRLAEGEEWDAARAVELVKRLPAVPDSDPLVSILIPAYSPRFFETCLESALAQTYHALEIVIGDDCPDDEIKRIVTDLAGDDRRVRYIRHERTLGGRWNYIRLFELANGEYIKFLNDDDLLDPECVQIMAACLRTRPEVTLVTSYRQAIDAAGNHLPDMPATTSPVAQDSLVNGETLATAVLEQELNFIGEPTTTMFRKSDAARIRPHILSFAGRPSAGNGDVNLWISLLSMGDAIYLTRPLSSFRQHEGQRQKCAEAIERGRRGWKQLRRDAAFMGFLQPAGCSARDDIAVEQAAWSR